MCFTVWVRGGFILGSKDAYFSHVLLAISIIGQEKPGEEEDMIGEYMFDKQPGSQRTPGVEENRRLLLAFASRTD